VSKNFTKQLNESLKDDRPGIELTSKFQSDGGYSQSKRLSNARIIAIELVHPDENQPRKEFDPAKMQELMNSIQMHGILQPLTVRSEDAGTFVLITGERRYRAARDLGIAELPCMILKPSDGKDIFAKQLIENLCREDLNVVDKAYALLEYKGMLGENAPWSEVEAMLGISESTRKNYVRILNLPEEMQKEIVSFKKEAKTPMSIGHAKALHLIKDFPDEQKALFDKIIYQEFVPAEDAMVMAREIRDKHAIKSTVLSLTFKYTDKKDLIRQLTEKLRVLKAKK
jgi:ParB family chromosome partitioning protein